MRYLKYNEASLKSLLGNDSIEKFDKIVSEFKSYLTKNGYKIGEIELSNFGLEGHKTLENSSFNASKSDNIIDFLFYIPEKNFKFSKSKYINIICNGFLKSEYGNGNNLSARSAYDLGEMGKNRSESFTINSIDLDSLIEILECCEEELKQRNFLKSKRLDFYDEFPVEDIKDYLIDLFDNIGKYEISKLDDSGLLSGLFGDRITPGYYVDFEHVNEIESVEIGSFHYSNCLDFSGIITDIGETAKRLYSIGLSMKMDIHSLANNGGVSLIITKKINTENEH